MHGGVHDGGARSSCADCWSVAYEPEWYAVLRQGNRTRGGLEDAGTDILEVAVADHEVPEEATALVFRVTPMPDGGYAVEGQGALPGTSMTRADAVVEASRLAQRAAEHGFRALVTVWGPDGSAQDLLRIDPRPNVLIVRIDSSEISRLLRP